MTITESIGKINENVKMHNEQEDHVPVNKTGIDKLDILLHGGIPEGHVVLLSGNSGTGKTILALQWLFSGYQKFDAPGIYVTLTEPVTKALKNAKTMSFYDETIVNQLQIHFTDLRAISNMLNISKRNIAKTQIDEILAVIENLVRETGAKRLVVDSITAMAYMLQDKDLIRYFVFKLGTSLANLNCSTILTSEVTGEGYSVFGVEEFISDGIIKLEHKKVEDETTRTLQIVKMRGINYNPEINNFKINRNGINLQLTLKTPLSYLSPTKKISTGISGLDEMCKGGVFKGSATLIAGSTGTGKTVTCLQFLVEGLRKRRSCLYASFEESKEQLLRTAKGFGWNLEEYEKAGLLTFLCSYPDKANPFEQLETIKNIVESKNVKRIAIDSLSSIANVLPVTVFRDFSRKLIAYLKSNGVTSYVTAATATLVGAQTITEAHLSTITDNIFLLKYVEVGGELKRMITTLKTRSSDRDKKLRKYEINKQGLAVGEPLADFEGIMSGSTRKIQKLLEESEQRFKVLSDASIEGVVIHEGGRVLAANRAFVNMFGFDSIEQVLGIKMKLKRLIAPESLDRVAKYIKEGINQYEAFGLGKDGSKFPIWIHANEITYEDRPAFAAVLRDLTEQKMGERTQQAINEIFKLALTCETEEELAKTSLAIVEELTESKFGFIGEVNESGCFDAIALSDPSWEACRISEPKSLKLIKGIKIHGIWGKVLSDDKPLIVNDPGSHPDRIGTPKGHPKIETFLGFPLKQGDITFGMIALANKKKGYSDKDLITMKHISVAISEALMRKRAELNLKKSEDDVRLLSDQLKNALQYSRS